MSSNHAAEAYTDMINQLQAATRDNTPTLLILDKGESTSMSGANINVPLLYQAVAHLCHLVAEREGMQALQDELKYIVGTLAAEHEQPYTTVQ